MQLIHCTAKLQKEMGLKKADLAFHYTYHIQEAGGVHSYAVPGIIRKLNRMPMGTLEYAYPIEALRVMV